MPQPLHVLLVTSNPKEMAILRKALGHETMVTGAHDLPELKMLLQGGIYDMVLCDWSFGEGTWKDALEIVKESDPDLPVVILSDAQKKEWLEVLEAGASDLLAQPPQRPRLTAILDHAVAARQTRRAKASREKTRHVA